MALTPARQLAAKTLLPAKPQIKPTGVIKSPINVPKPVMGLGKPAVNFGGQARRVAAGQGRMVNGQIARQTVKPRRAMKVRPAIPQNRMYE